MREALVEDTRLDVEGDLGTDETAFNVAKGAKSERGEPECHEEGESRAEDRQDTDGDKETFAADAKSGDGDDFAVHGHAAEAKQDTDEDSHRDGEDEQAGNEAEKELQDLRVRAGVADN